jgi:hypothetical protein
MIDPDKVGSGEAESISTPDILVVQVADLNVLYNDVLASKAQALALNDTLGTNAEEGLVGSDLDGRLRGLVVSDGLLGLARSAGVLQDSLALSSSSPACACIY